MIDYYPICYGGSTFGKVKLGSGLALAQWLDATPGQPSSFNFIGEEELIKQSQPRSIESVPHSSFPRINIASNVHERFDDRRVLCSGLVSACNACPELICIFWALCLPIFPDLPHSIEFIKRTATGALNVSQGFHISRSSLL